MSKLLKSQLQLIVTTLNLIIEQLPDEITSGSTQKRTPQSIPQPDLLTPLITPWLEPTPFKGRNWRLWEIEQLKDNYTNKRPANTGIGHRTLKSAVEKYRCLTTSDSAPTAQKGRGNTPNWTTEEDRRLFDNWRKGVALDTGLANRSPSGCQIRFARLEKRYPDGTIPENSGNPETFSVAHNFQLAR